MGALKRLRRWTQAPHCDIPSSSEGPKVHGHAVQSLATFLGVRLQDLDRAAVFAEPPILPLPSARQELRGGDSLPTSPLPRPLNLPS